ncbi:MAG TPA: hypothetical protein VFL90_06940 [Methylomirabilota bacterium]|nr:hypothetical protein [Methylomirabilota bacterium]
MLSAFLSFGGCATKIREIPRQPLARQPAPLVERDHQECERAISGQLKGVWFPAEIEFAGCMIARNYQVYVQVLDASVEVKKASLRTTLPPARIVSDLVTCERAASRNVTLAEKLSRPAVSVAGVFFWPVTVGSMVASATVAVNRQRDYADCMTPLGYVVVPWDGDGRPRAATAETDRPAP